MSNKVSGLTVVITLAIENNKFEGGFWKWKSTL